MTKLILFTVFITFILESCYYDAENYLYPATSCDSIKGSYSIEVKPLLNNKCMACHSASAANGGVILETYDQVKLSAVRILGSIEHNSGISAMPKGEPKIPECDRKKIKLWIDAGTPNN